MGVTGQPRLSWGQERCSGVLTPLTTIHYCRSGRRTRNQESSWAQTSFLVRFPHVAGRHSSYTHTHRRARARAHTHIHTHTRARARARAPAFYLPVGKTTRGNRSSSWLTLLLGLARRWGWWGDTPLCIPPHTRAQSITVGNQLHLW